MPAPAYLAGQHESIRCCFDDAVLLVSVRVCPVQNERVGARAPTPGALLRDVRAPRFETAHRSVWVELDGGRGRTLLHCSDGVEILPRAT